MGLTPVPKGELATIVTSLEMTARPRPSPLPESSLRLVAWPEPSLGKYRTLFRRVGEPWLWFSRLVMAEDALRAIIHDPNVRVSAVVDRTGIEVGMLELDFREQGQCEIAYFGLVPELAGKGNGGWLMAQALAAAWRKDVTRLWVHTCTLDHPAALNFYRKSGFTPYASAVEIFPDPRLIDIIPRACAPHIPLLDVT